MLLWEEAKKKYPLLRASVPAMQHGDFRHNPISENFSE
jgi:hypothetical protein